MSDYQEAEQGPKSSFETYVAEGDQLFLKSDYVKAIESYSTALQLKPGDRNCLVARSKCHLKLGDAEASLKDAEESLLTDKEFFKGLYRKAEALYAMGKFEFALVFYHRGHKLRPELQEFRLGIQKAQEAIENSVGSPSSVKLENKGDLSFFRKQEEIATHKSQSKNQRKDQRQQKKKKEETPRNEKTVRQLLGELYNDREYLEKLLKDEDLVKGNTRSGIKVQDLILSGITYLDTRTDFWRQQKPIYARDRDRKLMQQKWNRSKQSKPSDPTKYILKSLEEIDQLLTSGKAESSLKKAKQVLKTVQNWQDEDVPNKPEVIGNLYSCIGNAYIEMGNMDEALENHNKDLETAKQYDLQDAKSRALDNIGRVYARIGEFRKAIEVWEQKIPALKSSIEKTWLYHELGRCYLELNCNSKAKDYGEKSLASAEEAGDSEWQLNATVLAAQSEVKLGDNQAAVSYFEKALEIAKLLNDEAAHQAIMNALEDANKNIIEELKGQAIKKENELESEEEKQDPSKEEEEEEDYQSRRYEDIPEE
ncbi:outer dynein arm-docking complex subunit 4-like isoform X1 [Protopterus annectens]|uniref:outer dynein arm-docking complex subunit 4-like isoform X1 n=1 Tax=Protopterus annectens TaxID=7888 RepID=UPI001CFAF34B|nr:outer dynein arm-docking complex subunit 4-like isoform X1 [Protopterus annectens]